MLLQLPEAIFDPHHIICQADSAPVGKQTEPSDTAIGSSLGRGFLCCFFPFPAHSALPLHIPSLQAWNLLAKTTSQHPGALSRLCNSGEVELLLAAKQLHKPPCHLTAHPASPDTSWTPGLSWLLAHRQHFFLLPPGSAFRASIKMG